MAEELDYVPMPATVVELDQEDLGERDQGRRRQAAAELGEGLRCRQATYRGSGWSSACMPAVKDSACGRRRLRARRLSASGEACHGGSSGEKAIPGGLRSCRRGRSACTQRLATRATRPFPLASTFARGASGVLLILGGVIISLINGSFPAIKAFGFGFLVTEVWNPVTEQYRRLAPRSTARSSRPSSPC